MSGVPPAAAATKRYLVRQPKALQYFHHGKLQRQSDEERQAGRFELFLDLLYVALVANFADNLAENPSGARLVKYILIYTPAWHAWSDLKEIMNSYYNDDLLQRILILWFMALLVVYGNNAAFVDEDIGALRTTVGVYLVARLSTAALYTFYSFASHFHRPQNRVFAALIFLGLFIWIPVFLETVSLRAKIAVAVVAVVYEEIAWIVSFSPWIKSVLKLKYSTAVDIPHEIDRQGAFYIIVLGEFLYGIVVSSPAAIGLNTNALRAIWTLVIAFCLNWLYVNGDGSLNVTHPLRRAIWSAYAWFLLHLPLTASLLIGGHICAVAVKEEELSQGSRWLLGGGLGVGTFVLFIISICFKSDDSPKALLFPKAARMMPRLVVAVILALLPVVSEKYLNPTQLISICAGLFVFLVIWETIGGLQRGFSAFEEWDCLIGQADKDEESDVKPDGEA